MTYRDNLPGYQAFDGTWHRIFFPDGPPAVNSEISLPHTAYDEETKRRWADFTKNGRFVDGVLPSLAPPRECTTWDF